MTLLGARSTPVLHPANPGYVNGEWVEPYRVPTTEMLTIEPVSPGDQARNLAPEGAYATGAICIFAESDVLDVPSDENGQAGSWVEFNGELYEVRARNAWYDDIIGHVEYYAYLLRPQPANIEPEPEPEE
jgi:hypothetical protein